jgi:hypothetical protein
MARGGKEIYALLKKGVSVEEAEEIFYKKHSLKRQKI